METFVSASYPLLDDTKLVILIIDVVDHDQEYTSAFGQHLKKLRLEAGLTQEQLAKKSNVDFTQVHRYERGVR